MTDRQISYYGINTTLNYDRIQAFKNKYRRTSRDCICNPGPVFSIPGFGIGGLFFLHFHNPEIPGLKHRQSRDSGSRDCNPYQGTYMYIIDRVRLRPCRPMGPHSKDAQSLRIHWMDASAAAPG